MSEEKLYEVKNDEGRYWDFMCEDGFHDFDSVYVHTTDKKQQAETVADNEGGHVVTFVEEPKKVVLTEEQAKIVEGAKKNNYPATFISDQSRDEELLMNAYVNGYTVAKEKKYRVIAPRSWWYDDDAPLYLLRDFTDGMQLTVKRDNPSTVFTKKQLNAFELDGAPFKKEEVTDDGIR